MTFGRSVSLCRTQVPAALTGEVLLQTDGSATTRELRPPGPGSAGFIPQPRACPTELATGILNVYGRRVRIVLAEMIATRGFVRTTHFSRARLSHFPTDVEALRVGHPQIRLVLICVLVCRGHCIPCSACSSVALRRSLLILQMPNPRFARSIVPGCAPWIAAEPKCLFFVPLPEYAFCQYSVFRIHVAWVGAST